MSEFSGFDRATFEFFRDLSEPDNCNKEWFHAHRERYESAVVGPIKAFVEAVAPALSRLQPDFELRPHTNRTLTRINRDMRFVRNLPPYKDHMLALFYREERKKEDAQLFLGIQPDTVWSGLYVGGHLLGDERAANGAEAAELAALGRAAGVGERYRLVVCERYGEVERELSPSDDEAYLTGPHLVVLRDLPERQVVGLGAGVVADFERTAEELHPLWAAYSGA